MHVGWITRIAMMGFALCSIGCAIRGPQETVAEGRDVADSTATDERDDHRPPDDARPPLPIVQGTEATAFPSAVIVNMKNGPWQVSVCSGAVIAPRLVLTAGHCAVGDFDNWDVVAPYAGGQTAHASEAEVYDYTSTGDVVNANQHDVALLVLDSPITLTAYPQIDGVTAPSGTAVRSIGRVDDGVMSYTRLFVSQAIAIAPGNSWGHPHAYVSSEVIQPGDSGGPVVVDGSSPPRIVAVNSGAGGGIQVLARIDQVHGWIADQIAAHDVPDTPDPPADPCGGVTYEGQCDGAVLSWCDNGEVSTIDCGSHGRACGWDGGNGFYNCL